MGTASAQAAAVYAPYFENCPAILGGAFSLLSLIGDTTLGSNASGATTPISGAERVEL
jgi:hypothetical protein